MNGAELRLPRGATFEFALLAGFSNSPPVGILLGISDSP
jgi:hypothetical protein